MADKKDCPASSSPSSKARKKGCKSQRHWYYVDNSSAEADTLKDKFYRDLEQGRIDVFKSIDLYTRVKNSSKGKALDIIDVGEGCLNVGTNGEKVVDDSGSGIIHNQWADVSCKNKISKHQSVSVVGEKRMSFDTNKCRTKASVCKSQLLSSLSLSRFNRKSGLPKSSCESITYRSAENAEDLLKLKDTKLHADNVTNLRIKAETVSGDSDKTKLSVSLCNDVTSVTNTEEPCLTLTPGSVSGYESGSVPSNCSSSGGWGGGSGWGIGSVSPGDPPVGIQVKLHQDVAAAMGDTLLHITGHMQSHLNTSENVYKCHVDTAKADVANASCDGNTSSKKSIGGNLCNDVSSGGEDGSRIQNDNKCSLDAELDRQRRSKKRKSSQLAEYRRRKRNNCRRRRDTESLASSRSPNRAGSSILKSKSRTSMIQRNNKRSQKRAKNFIYVEVGTEEADTLKDKFWRNLENGILDPSKTKDLYSKVKASKRTRAEADIDDQDSMDNTGFLSVESTTNREGRDNSQEQGDSFADSHKDFFAATMLNGNVRRKTRPQRFRTSCRQINREHRFVSRRFHSAKKGVTGGTSRGVPERHCVDDVTKKQPNGIVQKKNLRTYGCHVTDSCSLSHDVCHEMHSCQSRSQSETSLLRSEVEMYGSSETSLLDCKVKLDRLAPHDIVRRTRRDDYDDYDNDSAGSRTVSSTKRFRSVIKKSSGEVRSRRRLRRKSQFYRVYNGDSSSDEMTMTPRRDCCFTSLKNHRSCKDTRLRLREMLLMSRSDECLTRKRKLVKDSPPQLHKILNHREDSGLELKRTSKVVDSSGSTNGWKMLATGTTECSTLEHRASVRKLAACRRVEAGCSADRTLAVAELDDYREMSEAQRNLWRSVHNNDYLAARLILTTLNIHDINQPTSYTGRTLIIAAAQESFADMIWLLSAHGADVNVHDKDGCTALMTAAKRGCALTVATLLDAGAHIDVRNNVGDTALLLAVRGGHWTVVELLLGNGANFASTNNDINLAALHCAKRMETSSACSQTVLEIISAHALRVTTSFVTEVMALLSRVEADIIFALFPLQCFSLSDGQIFSSKFIYDSRFQAVRPDGGVLLFVGHARIGTNTVSCKLHGTCAVVQAKLNDVPLQPVTDNLYFVTSFMPLVDGLNHLIIETIDAPRSKVKLLVCAYSVQLSQFTSSAAAPSHSLLPPACSAASDCVPPKAPTNSPASLPVHTPIESSSLPLTGNISEVTAALSECLIPSLGSDTLVALASALGDSLPMINIPPLPLARSTTPTDCPLAALCKTPSASDITPSDCMPSRSSVINPC